MNKNNFFITYILIIIFITITLFSGCINPNINKSWREIDIIIDGQDIEWRDVSNYYEKKSNIVIGFLNDKEHLYIRLSTTDRRLQGKIALLGLIVWFDPKGGKKERFGIKFPVLRKDIGLLVFQRDQEKNFEEQRKMIEESQKDLEILVPGEKKSNRMPVATASTLGINVKMGYSMGNLIYEMKVPLDQSEKYIYAIGAENNSKIGIGFETGKINMEDFEKMRAEIKSQMEGRRGTGGIGRDEMGLGGMRRGRTGRMPKAVLNTPEPFNLWVKVTLVSGY